MPIKNANPPKIKDYQPTLTPKPEQKPHIIKKALLILISSFIISSIGLCALLRWMSPPTTAFMLHQHVDDFFNDQAFTAIHYQWVSGDKIAKHAFLAVIAAEDQHFFEHAGFDLNAIESAIEHYVDGGSLRGASTLSQQVAKNLFLTPHKNFIRKGLEVWFTVLCEALWSKERILLMYLNIAEFGDHIFGIEAASHYYFGTSAQKINREQAALLAATLPNPLLLKALQPTKAVIKRQQWILRQMRNLELPAAE
ncbi:MAG: monofunctional biosynthetic peptidoglycan transglycosylase [Methylococcaceae bacterium]|nr:monofunctional biosynthetic peptidoglycan transglycosylase [Methylococcaceae bacterium]